MMMEKARACGIPDICAPECSVWSVVLVIQRSCGATEGRGLMFAIVAPVVCEP